MGTPSFNTPTHPDGIDAVGRYHAPAGANCRIVSLVPSITELLCYLGLADRLVGRTGFCIHPRDRVRTIPKVGGTKTLKFDAIRTLAPTHVIANIDENNRPDIERLAEFVPHIVVTHPCAPADNLALYRLLGHVFRRRLRAQKLCTAFEKRLAALAAENFAPRNVLYAIWKDPWMTVSPDTYIAGMLRLVNWHTLPNPPTERYPTFMSNDAWLRDVDLVLLSSEPYRFRENHADILRAWPALARKPMRLIDGEMTSWYGSRAVAGLDYLRDFARGIDSGTVT